VHHRRGNGKNKKTKKKKKATYPSQKNVLQPLSPFLSLTREDVVVIGEIFEHAHVLHGLDREGEWFRRLMHPSNRVGVIVCQRAERSSILRLKDRSVRGCVIRGEKNGLLHVLTAIGHVHAVQAIV